LYNYYEYELEVWREFLSSALPKAVVLLYIVSLVILTAYSLYYVASVGVYLEVRQRRAPQRPSPLPISYRARSHPYDRDPSPGYPRVAVVYPVYNDYEILTSIEKALQLDYPDYYIIIVDDSSDQSLVVRLSNLALNNPRVLHLRRPGREGLKAGALNDAVRLASQIGAEYMLVLDADFEPPPWLLRDLVGMALATGAPAVQGHQKHSKGAVGVFGRLYRASMAGAIIFMAGREELDLFPIFTGSVGLIRVDKALEVPFTEGSISEDLRWTIDLLANDKHAWITVMPEAYAEGSVPTGLRAFYKQQVRWSEGTLRELMNTWLTILPDRAIRAREKIGYLLQTLFYTQGIWVYVNTLAPFIYALLTGGTIPFVWLLGVYLWFMGIESILVAGSIQEELDRKTILTIAFAALGYIYLTAIIHTVGTLRALLARRPAWTVTPKRGAHEHEYKE